MALGFGRKKPAPEAQDAPQPSTTAPSAPAPNVAAPNPAPGNAASTTPETDDNLNSFDLDSFATQLESGAPGTGAGQKSPFDEMFTEPAATTAAGSGKSAYDFPDLDEENGATIEATTQPASLDLNAMYEAEQRDAIASGKIPPPNVPIPLPNNLSEVATEPTGLFEPQTESPKKKLPLIPIVGALAVLALAGGAATYFSQGGGDEEIEAPVALPPRPEEPPGNPSAPNAPGNPPAPATQAKPPAPSQAAAPVAAAPAAASVALTPALKSQLKALWKEGANAKHRGDNKAARAAWQQALKVRPGHPGFAEAIAKLPQ